MENSNNQDVQNNNELNATQEPVKQASQEQPISGANVNSASQSPLSDNQNQINQPVGTNENKSSQTDILGIISLVIIVVGFNIVGVIIGFIGMRKAKKEGYSPILSQIGFWVNLAITILVTIIFVFIFGISFLSAINA